MVLRNAAKFLYLYFFPFGPPDSAASVRKKPVKEDENISITLLIDLATQKVERKIKEQSNQDANADKEGII